MGDVFNIEKVDKFQNISPLSEISDISKIIKEMINIKNDTDRIIQKRTKPYDIIEKIEHNGIKGVYKEKIKKNHLDSYDVVDDAISCLENYEASIRDDLFDYYWEVYTNTLILLSIEISDEESIKQNAEKIYTNILKAIDEELFSGKSTDIETNKKVTYIAAITAYVFYQCKFLIPIDTISVKYDEGVNTI